MDQSHQSTLYFKALCTGRLLPALQLKFHARLGSSAAQSLLFVDLLIGAEEATSNHEPTAQEKHDE